MKKVKRFIRRKPQTVEAVQWFKKGDFSEDDFEDNWYEEDEFSKELPICPRCGRKRVGVHGKVAGHDVCPSDWIVGELAFIMDIMVMSDTAFKKLYKEAK